MSAKFCDYRDIVGDQNATQEVLGRKIEEGELLGAQHFR
jgi:hypothetical protein